VSQELSQGVWGELGLGPIDQVAYVVHDMEASRPRYEAMFGPFEVGVVALKECTIRGLTADCTLEIAVNRSGPIEIELIAVLEGDTSHSEHLRVHGEGLHHVRFRVDDLDAKLAAMRAAGFEVVFEKRLGPTIAFAYLETPRALGRSVVELLQMP